jgi:thiol-disulfide isomerase/thioredoxin
MPPIDVKSSKDIRSMIQRIVKGPVTVILVYADWCGHCHHFMPVFDKCANSTNRTSQVIKINEKMMPEVEQSLQSVNQKINSLNVEAYPTVLAVNRRAENLATIPTDENTVSSVMNKSNEIMNMNNSMNSMNNSINSMNNSINKSFQPISAIPMSTRIPKRTMQPSSHSLSVNNMKSLHKTQNNAFYNNHITPILNDADKIYGKVPKKRKITGGFFTQLTKLY